MIKTAVEEEDGDLLKKMFIKSTVRRIGLEKKK